MGRRPGTVRRPLIGSPSGASHDRRVRDPMLERIRSVPSCVVCTTVRSAPSSSTRTISGGRVADCNTNPKPSPTGAASMNRAPHASSVVPSHRRGVGLRVDVEHDRVEVANADREESLLVPPRESGHVDVRRVHPDHLRRRRVHQQELAGGDESIAAERFDDGEPGAVRRAADPAELDVALQERSVEAGREVDHARVARRTTRPHPGRPRRWPRSDRSRTSSPPKRSARIFRRERPLPSRRRSCRDAVACRPLAPLTRPPGSTRACHRRPRWSRSRPRRTVPRRARPPRPGSGCRRAPMRGARRHLPPRAAPAPRRSRRWTIDRAGVGPGGPIGPERERSAVRRPPGLRRRRAGRSSPAGAPSRRHRRGRSGLPGGLPARPGVRPGRRSSGRRARAAGRSGR